MHSVTCVAVLRLLVAGAATAVDQAIVAAVVAAGADLSEFQTHAVVIDHPAVHADDEKSEPLVCTGAAVEVCLAGVLFADVVPKASVKTFAVEQSEFVAAGIAELSDAEESDTDSLPDGAEKNQPQY